MAPNGWNLFIPESRIIADRSIFTNKAVISIVVYPRFNSEVQQIEEAGKEMLSSILWALNTNT
jgi:hypothetical protein